MVSILSVGILYLNFSFYFIKKGKRDALADFRSGEFIQVIDEQNQLYAKVSWQSEAKLDFEQLELIGDVAVRQMRLTKELDNASVMQQWFSSLKHKFPSAISGSVDLSALGKSAVGVLAPVPLFRSVYIFALCCGLLVYFFPFF